ncbi:XRE family transcriptional regulator [Puteibacter caeruleilacunae]|nr:XRE family transcriptional regulator [Puteibacter caeruleilacunae]
MDINARIREYCKREKITQISLSELTEVSKQSVNSIFKDRHLPGVDFIKKMLTAFPGIDARWLITGLQSELKTDINNKSTVNSDKDFSFQEEKIQLLEKHLKEQREEIEFYRELLRQKFE